MAVIEPHPLKPETEKSQQQSPPAHFSLVHEPDVSLSSKTQEGRGRGNGLQPEHKLEEQFPFKEGWRRQTLRSNTFTMKRSLASSARKHCLAQTCGREADTNGVLPGPCTWSASSLPGPQPQLQRPPQWFLLVFLLQFTLCPMRQLNNFLKL